MFLLLVAAVIMHQFYATVSEKSDDWPLRKFAVRLVECIGRITIFPIAGIFFVLQIKSLSEPLVVGMFFVIVPASGVIALREFAAVRNSWHSSFQLLIDKLNNPETKVSDLSKIEAIVINISLFHTFSYKTYRIAAELAQHGSIETGKQNGVSLSRWFAAKMMLNGTHHGKSNEVDVCAPTTETRTDTVDHYYNTQVDSGLDHGDIYYAGDQDIEQQASPQPLQQPSSSLPPRPRNHGSMNPRRLQQNQNNRQQYTNAQLCSPSPSGSVLSQQTSISSISSATSNNLHPLRRASIELAGSINNDNNLKQHFHSTSVKKVNDNYDRNMSSRNYHDSDDEN